MQIHVALALQNIELMKTITILSFFTMALLQTISFSIKAEPTHCLDRAYQVQISDQGHVTQGQLCWNENYHVQDREEQIPRNEVMSFRNPHILTAQKKYKLALGHGHFWCTQLGYQTQISVTETNSIFATKVISPSFDAKNYSPLNLHVAPAKNDTFTDDLFCANKFYNLEAIARSRMPRKYRYDYTYRVDPAPLSRQND